MGLVPRLTRFPGACRPAAAGLERPEISAARSANCAPELVVDSHLQVKPASGEFSGGAPKECKLEINYLTLSNSVLVSKCIRAVWWRYRGLRTSRLGQIVSS